MRHMNRKGEQGISLMLAVIALMLLSAIAAGMMFMSSTESSISGNYKTEEAAYFAARGGVEEARDRMLINSPNTISANLPTTLPNAAGGVLYILQNGTNAANITNLVSSNNLADDELCHDFAYSGIGYGGMTPVPSNVRCTSLPGGGGWFTTVNSVAPFPLEYRWVRVTLKANNSTPAWVDATQPAASQVCWNGTSEVVLLPFELNCSSKVPTANPVYMLTSLAVMNNNSRRIVQQEVAQTPPGTLPGGMFAVGTGCGALNIAGNAKTGSFNSSTEPTPTNPPSNLAMNNGNVGTNGNTNLGGTSTDINGIIGTNLTPTVGSCPGNGVTVTGNPDYNGISNFATPYTPPVPPMPNPLPPVTNVTVRNSTMVPGSYGNVTLKGNVTITGGTPSNPAVYTLNSLTFNGNANVTITGSVIFNIAGVGQTTAVDMTGGSFSNTTYVPSNFVINYGGTDNVVISGGAGAFAVVNAPKANITMLGGSDFYGQMIGLTINDQGGTNFYWDTSLNAPVPNTAPFYEISMRELSY